MHLSRSYCSPSAGTQRCLPPGKVDFKAAGIPEYADCFAMILDSLFTSAELASFLATAESAAPWEPARVNATADQAFLMPDYRNGERIILDDVGLATRIFERIRPHLSEVEEMKWGGGLAWKMVGMNERLRFLRYPVGGFFRPHYDGGRRLNLSSRLDRARLLLSSRPSRHLQPTSATASISEPFSPSSSTCPHQPTARLNHCSRAREERLASSVRAWTTMSTSSRFLDVYLCSSTPNCCTQVKM